MNKIKILDICHNLPVTQHSVHAIPLSIILSDNQHLGWLYQNFVQVYSRLKLNSNMKQRMYYYGMNNAVYSQLLSTNKVEKFDHVDNIVEYIIGFIDNSLYISVYIDMFFVKEKEYAHGQHYNQKVLIFGYDSEKKIFYVKGYNHNSVFTTFVIKFDEIFQAFKICNSSNSETRNPFYIEIHEFTGKQKSIEFSLEKYKLQLKDYLYSKCEAEEFQQNEGYLKKVRYVGMDAYRDFENYIEIAIRERYGIAYHDFHLFYEHRKMNLDRLIYINHTYEKNVSTDDYAKLVDGCARLRFSYMKNAIKQGNLYSQIRDRELMIEYKRKMHTLNSEEAEIWTEIMKEI